MKLNKFILVSIFLLAIISFGAVCAAEDISADDLAVDDVTADDLAVEEGDVDLGSPVTDEIDAGADVLEDVGDSQDKLSVNEEEEVISDPVSPQYTYDIDLPISGSAYVVQWGQPIPISANFTNATGDVTITFEGETYTTSLVNGAFTYEITKFSRISSNRPLKIVYGGDANYKSVSIQKNIHVQMSGVVAHDADYGQKPYIDVDLHNATGNVTFTINGVTYRKLLEDGKAIQEFTNYTLGRNTVSFAYEGDENYNPISKSYNFNVKANIDEPTIYNFQNAVVTAFLGEATGNVTFKLGNETHNVSIVNGKASCEFQNYSIGSNTISIAYSGDDTFNPFSTTKTLNVLDKENPVILSSVYKTADKNMVIISIPHGTGNVTAVINGKKEILELVDCIATYNIGENDVITEINVTYDGNFRLNPGNNTVFKELNNVVNNETYMYYFNQVDGGKIFSFIEDGTTLDFQGSIINPDQAKNIFFDVNKPVNIVSTTNDAYVDLNTTAGSLMGENPGNRFTISNGGSWTNMTGITFHNTQLWIFNTHHVVLDRVNNIIEDQRVGSGVGATSIRQNSTWVTVKNGYFYTRNNGGSSSLVIAWADYCTFDNNTVVVEGNVGNMIYLTTYNVEIPSGVMANKFNNITNNKIYGPQKGAAICLAMVVYGSENLFANNYVDYGGVGMTIQFGASGVLNNTYANNTLVGGASASLPGGSTAYGNYVSGTFSTSTDSVVYNNTVLKAMTVGDRSEVYNNTVAGFTLSGADAIVEDNTVNGATTISAANIQIKDNTFLGDNTIKFSNKNAKNVTFANNSVVGNIEIANTNAKGNIITGNNITTAKDYAIDLKTYVGTETVITDNILNSNKGLGNAAIKHNEDESLVIENGQNVSAQIIVETADINVDETAVFNVTCNETSVTTAVVLVDNKQYTVTLAEGKGSVEVTGLLAGTYDVKVYTFDKNVGAQNTTSITVSKFNCPEIIVEAPDKTQWINSTITVTVSGVTGTVELSINGEKLSAEFVDGVAVINVPDLAPGQYNFTVKYLGDYKYLDNETNASLTVNKNKEVKIIAADVTFDKLATSFTAKFTNYIGEAIAGANVTVIIDNQTYNLTTDANGDVNVDLALTRGNYPVNIQFKAIENEFDAQTAEVTIYVSDATVMEIVSISGDCSIVGSLKDVYGAPVAGAVVSYVIDGVKTNTTTDANGLFHIQAKNDCNVSILFEGDAISTSSSKTIALNNVAHVVKDVVIDIKGRSYVAVDTAAKEKGKMFYFNLRDADGNNLTNKSVMVSFNGKVYNLKTDANGSAGINIAVSSKTYALDVFFIGDDDYKGSHAAVKVKVVKKASSIKPKKAKYVFKAKAKSKVIQATLKTTNKFLKAGKKVTIKIKGKTYTAKTGKNGLIKFNIKNLKKKGTYKAKITFAGDSVYKASSSKIIKIVIK